MDVLSSLRAMPGLFTSVDDFRKSYLARFDATMVQLQKEVDASGFQYSTTYIYGVGNIRLENRTLETKQSEQGERSLFSREVPLLTPEAVAAPCSELVGFGDGGSSGVPGNGSTAPEVDREEE